MATAERLKDAYIAWIKDHLTVKEIKRSLDAGRPVVEITTPLLDSRNDHLQIVVEIKGDRLRLSDQASTVNELELSGVDINSSKKRQEIMARILNGFGIQCSEQGELFVEAAWEDFPVKGHMLLHAMLAVGDMFMLARPNVATIFLEDVAQYLMSNEVRYIENIQMAGRSGLPYRFDFVIPSSRIAPERLVQTVNHPTRQNAEKWLFAWNDTRVNRKADMEFIVMLNDVRDRISSVILTAFSQYDTVPVPWSQRESHIERLRA